jgi:hypothetical protein
VCNLDSQRIEKLVTALKDWSRKSSRVKGAALLGSWPGEKHHAEADVDIVLIVDDPARYRAESNWMTEIDWPAAGLDQGHWSECDYGRACSRHFKFHDGAEVEVSFVDPTWASVDPIDPSTRRIAASGMRVIHDPNGLLGRLIAVL